MMNVKEVINETGDKGQVYKYICYMMNVKATIRAITTVKNKFINIFVI